MESKSCSLASLSQDVHGAWDIKFNTGVLPHTAIPEVDAAVNMFAKAGVPLSEFSDCHTYFLCTRNCQDTVNLGIGFYGRSFTLANPSCNTAGCPMKGSGAPGPCTGAFFRFNSRRFNLMRHLCIRRIRYSIVWGNRTFDSDKKPQSAVQQNFADHGTYLR